MMKLRLIQSSMEYREQITEMMDEWSPSREDPFAIWVHDYHDFENYCARLNITDPLVPGFVTDTTFFCFDEERDKVVGAVNIRHYLNEFLLNEAGHIGDGVRPSERRKGIATKMIGLALEECKKLGIYRVLMTCDKNNIASAKSIVNNGGVLEDERVTEHDITQRYWIDLSSQIDPYATCIRHASIEEIPQCVQVVRNAFQTVADQFHFTKENAPQFTAYAINEQKIQDLFCKTELPAYVFLQGTKIVGYYSLRPLNDEEMELNNLSVLPQMRHQGIGQKMLTHCAEQVRLMGRSKIKIGIVEENQVLRKWYEQNGFIHTGTEKFDFFPFTCGYMERRIED